MWVAVPAPGWNARTEVPGGGGSVPHTGGLEWSGQMTHVECPSPLAPGNYSNFQSCAKSQKSTPFQQSGVPF
jgi:hypothetical protein